MKRGEQHYKFISHFHRTKERFELDKYNEFDLTDSQYNTLKKFRDDFKVFSDKYNEAFEFIDTPEWAEIIEKAKIVLRAFNYIKKS